MYLDISDEVAFIRNKSRESFPSKSNLVFVPVVVTLALFCASWDPGCHSMNVILPIARSKE